MPEYHCQQQMFISGINDPVRVRVEVRSQSVISQSVRDALMRAMMDAHDGIRNAELKRRNEADQ